MVFWGEGAPAKTDNSSLPSGNWGHGSAGAALRRNAPIASFLLCSFLFRSVARSVDNPNAIESGRRRRREPPCRGGASAPPRAASGRFERLPRGRRPSWPRDAVDAGAALFRLSCFFHSFFLPAPAARVCRISPGGGAETGRPGAPLGAACALGACGRLAPFFSAWVSAAPSGRRSFEKPPRRGGAAPPPRIAAAGARRAQQATEERTRHGFHQSDCRIGRGHVRRPVD